MDYAEVCVNSPAARRRTFSYSIPPHLNVVAGQAVLVPFGSQILQGIVLRLTAEAAVEQTKDIAGVIDSNPLLTSERIELARWISDYYLAPIFDAVALMLPPGFERKVLTFVTTSIPEGFEVSTLPDEQKQIIEEVAIQGKPVNVSILGRVHGKKKVRQLITQLVKKNLLARTYILEPVKIKVKMERRFTLKVSPAEALREADIIRPKAKRQADLLELLASLQEPASSETIKQRIAFSKSTADSLIKKGLLVSIEQSVRRNPLAHLNTNLSWPLPLTPNQTVAFNEIKASFEVTKSINSDKVFLLNGITGSGKTEVYLQALAEAVRHGNKGIVLVPEIALTPQTLERFTARFPGRVAVLHSQLTLGEQFDEWNRIRNGEADVVIGPRSALFAPQPDLGLIVVDEEHEWSYKQTEQSPFYHARTAVLKLAALTGASVILGSATPDLESYYRAMKGEFKLLELPERLVSGVPAEDSTSRSIVQETANGSLPAIELVDMRQELKNGNRSLFSNTLHEALTNVLSSGGQAILFLNRRGASTFLQCRWCGFSFLCRRCDVPMTYHAVQDALICHQCNYQVSKPDSCPRCRGTQIKFLGLGTEKLEQETAQAFPKVRLLRWDSDTTKGWHSHQDILDRFRRHEAEILIGTQMVSKGLDIPGVTLVGIINADTGLNMPDFRAGERTFQLLCQVAGRAGRGPMGGKVVIQTYSPEHYVIKAAAAQDYGIFFKQELEYRRQLHQPPFTRLTSMVYSHTNEGACRREAERMRDYLNDQKRAGGISGVEIIGPAPAFIHRRRGHYRWHLIIRSPDPSEFMSKVAIPPNWSINVDPVGLN